MGLHTRSDLKTTYLAKFHGTLVQMSRRWGGGTPGNWDRIDSICRVVSTHPKTDLQRCGDESRYCFYVGRGLLRLYYTTKSGKELNKCFYSEGGFAADFSASYLGKPSRFSIATIENCILVLVPIREYRELLKSIPDLEVLSGQVMNTLMVRNERREEELLTMSAQERFIRFATNFPAYLSRVPQHHIASYLGITPECLSANKKAWLSGLPDTLA